MSNILVVGGPGSVIGAHLIAELMGEGHRVIATYKSSNVGHPQPLGERGVILRELDVRDSAGVHNLVRSIEDEIGPVHGLVNNAACSFDSAVVDMREEDWRRVLDINLTGVFNTCKAVAEVMLQRGHGQIVNIASIKGITGGAEESAYAASKAAVIAFQNRWLASWLPLKFR